VLCPVTEPGVVCEMFSAESVTAPVVITPGRFTFVAVIVCPGGSVARATGGSITAPSAFAVAPNAWPLAVTVWNVKVPAPVPPASPPSR